MQHEFEEYVEVDHTDLGSNLDQYIIQKIIRKYKNRVKEGVGIIKELYVPVIYEDMPIAQDPSSYVKIRCKIVATVYNPKIGDIVEMTIVSLSNGIAKLSSLYLILYSPVGPSGTIKYDDAKMKFNVNGKEIKEGDIVNVRINNKMITKGARQISIIGEII